MACDNWRPIFSTMIHLTLEVHGAALSYNWQEFTSCQLRSHYKHGDLPESVVSNEIPTNTECGPRGYVLLLT
jgi:hypothetical protein